LNIAFQLINWLSEIMMMPATTNHILTGTEEHQLLQRLAAGEINAFWQIFQQHRVYLFRCCLKWMNGNSTEAEDLLSQAMVKAWEKVQKYAGKIDNFKCWLTTLTRNFWIDLTRRRGANQVEDIEVYADRNELGLVSVEDTPAIALDSDEKKRVIRRAIDELPTKMRETFILHFYEELSHQEISEKQNISYQNVCKRISQARAILREELRGYFIGEDGTKTELAVTPAVTESAIEEMSEGNAEVEAIAGESVTLSVAIAEVESVGGEELPEVAVSVGDSDSDSVAATSEGRLEEFNAIGKQIVGAFPPWLSSLRGSLLFHGLRKLVLEVRGEWCRWCGGDNGIRWGKLRENVRSSRYPPWYHLFYFQSLFKSMWGMILRVRLAVARDDMRSSLFLI
jgi:RNA polymerase sigma-70 factor (ECF subfamily)